jgi:type II secretory pathway pseudopilin PulG
VVQLTQAELKQAQGFSLIEVLVATIVLTVGLLSLVGVAAVGVQRVAQSSPMLIAREEAREAIESVHTARDTGEITWAKINNTTAAVPGVFLAGPQPLKIAGPDGLLNTADDGAIETIRTAGPDNILNNADDVITTLTNYTREIAITPMNCDAGDPPICGGAGVVNKNLRQIVVTVKYEVNGIWQTYAITTYISSFS